VQRSSGHTARPDPGRFAVAASFLDTFTIANHSTLLSVALTAFANSIILSAATARIYAPYSSLKQSRSSFPHSCNCNVLSAMSKKRGWDQYADPAQLDELGLGNSGADTYYDRRVCAFPSQPSTDRTAFQASMRPVS
jgi:hypothetical protein